MIRYGMLFLACLLGLITLTFAQAPRANGVNPQALAPVRPGSAIEQARARRRCDPFVRSYDGTCTNNFFLLWGSTNRAQSSLFFRATSTQPTGKNLPSAREISNKLFVQTADMANNRRMSQMVTFFAQFVDHTVVATSTSSTHFDIPIPKDDAIALNFSSSGFLSLKRSERVPVDVLGLYGSAPAGEAATIPFIVQADPKLAGLGVSTELPGINPSEISPQRAGTPGAPATQGLVPPTDVGASSDSPAAETFRRNVDALTTLERPINTLSSALDLASVYGPDETRAKALRTLSGGKMKTGPSNLLPRNSGSLNNAPLPNGDYFLAGDHRCNEHPVLLSIHTIFVREHNRLCDVFKSFSSNDEELYQWARSLNIAQFQKIVATEFYPVVTGRQLPAYRGFRFFRNPNVIDIFSTAAYRVGHTMVGNEVPRRDSNNKLLPPFTLRDIFFPLATLTESDPDRIEQVVRGTANSLAEEIDLKVHDLLRNGLFDGIPGEGELFDLMSLNIQRGRDHALPSYNDIRTRFGLGRAASFSQITSDPTTQSRLQEAYGNVDNVEAWPGLLAENKLGGSSMSATMYRIWERQFANMRDGDRLWYQRRNFLPSRFKRLAEYRAIFSSNNLFTQIVLRNTNIKASDIPRNIFRL